MAWEKLNSTQAGESTYKGSPAIFVALSCIWIALVLAGALLANFNEPYLPFVVGGVAVFFLRSDPSRWEIYAWLLISALMAVVIHTPQVPFWILRVAAAFSLLGFGALIVLGLRALWSESESRQSTIALLVPALILIAFIFGTARVLSFSSGLSPETRDAWLYAFDGSLGFQPSFAVGRIMIDSTLLTRSALLTYLSLPFAMATVCAFRIPVGSKRISWHMLTVLLLAGIGGWLAYNIVPGTGPIYAFGQGFPWNPPYKDLSTFVLQKMPISTGIPRNAMPSLHVGWVVLLWWNSRGFPRVLRATLLLYLALTVIATLGSGQHYLVDLVVSLPYALTVQSAASYIFGEKSTRVIGTMLTGLALTAGWLMLVRFGLPLMLKSPAIPWTLIVTTVALTLWLERSLWKNPVVESSEASLALLPTAAESTR
jgi:hypothetical protein